MSILHIFPICELLWTFYVKFSDMIENIDVQQSLMFSVIYQIDSLF